ncbi:hypothetical protein TYRP_012252 [Tyrophagus putrescentiae]|nr:hypothetical protein TYRP_012252 [Tyrophagus putrescentiae]
MLPKTVILLVLFFWLMRATLGPFSLPMVMAEDGGDDDGSVLSYCEADHIADEKDDEHCQLRSWTSVLSPRSSVGRHGGHGGIRHHNHNDHSYGHDGGHHSPRRPHVVHIEENIRHDDHYDFTKKEDEAENEMVVEEDVDFDVPDKTEEDETTSPDTIF